MNKYLNWYIKYADYVGLGIIALLVLSGSTIGALIMIAIEAMCKWMGRDKGVRIV